MSLESSEALVLRVIDFSETSCVVTLFTRDHGKVVALAKGARRPKGPFESALDLLANVRVVFIAKSNDTLDLLTEAKLERRFRSASSDLGALYGAYYIAELLMELTDRGDPYPELFAAADATLQWLDRGAAVPPLILRFELTALRLLGHLPTLRRCAVCQTEVLTDGRVAFGQLAGGVLCGRCRTGQRQVVSVRGAVIETLRNAAADREFHQPARELEPHVRGELRGLINHFLANLLGKRPRMYQYLGSLH